MTSTSSLIDKYKNNFTNDIENSKMNSNEENLNTSPGYNQGINNKNVVDTLTTSIITTTTTSSPSSSSTIITNVISSSNSASTSDFLVNTSTNKNISRPNAAGSIKDLDNLNEHQLKELLDEAFSYKNPKDRENKSETFRQMLENVEQEKDRIPSKHGGSLQDLVEAQVVHNDSILDYEYTYNNRNRRHHHNSRPKKYCSLVSARQREGGSLPSNVNVSNCNLTVYEPSFLNEVLNKRRIGGICGGGGGGTVVSGGNKNERAVSATSCNSGTSGNASIGAGGGHDSTCGKDIEILSNSGSIGGNNSADTIIDMGENYTDEKHLLAIDSSKKGYPSSMEDDCIEIGIQLNSSNKKFTPRAPGFNVAHQGKLEHTAPEPRHYVDEPITFAALERRIVDSTCLPLNENYPSCKSLMGEKSELVKPLYTSTKNITKQCDENGNSLNSTFNTTSSTSQSQAKAKKKKSQSDRNTKTYNVTSVAGYRGGDPVDVLVKYIENTEDDKKNDKTNKLNENKRKDKKRDKENNNKKFKKSNSLEELRSCTKLDEDEKQEIVGNVNVTMRNKNTNKQNKYNNNNNNNNGCSAGGIGSNVCSSTSSNSSTQSNSNEVKSENFKQQQLNHNKRGERRSWGTEELTYLGENNAIEEVREKVKDKEKKKSRELQQMNATLSSLNNNTIDISSSLSFQQNDNKMNKKKQDPISLSRISIDSLQCESAAEFHVVTKKKKSKKRQTNSDVSSEFNNRNSTGGLSTGGYGNTNNNNNNNKYKDGSTSGFGNQNKRYQILGNISNNRDLYLHSFNTNKDKKSRRKSTSSMPPSEKSDSSDLESVHSLPIESTTSSSSITRNNNNQSAHTTKSYADMARSNAAAAAAAEAAANSALGDKLDKWPTVSGGNDSSSSTSSGNGGGGGNGASGNDAICNSNIKNISNKKSCVTNKDFPELLTEKLNNNDPGNLSGTMNKPISYSQSLSTTEDRKMNQSALVMPLIMTEKHVPSNATCIKSPTLKPSTVTVASMTDGLRSNEIKITQPATIVTPNIASNKQILQKSKSVETDNYYNSMDQYPALEKTVKRHVTTSSIATTPILLQQQNIVNINNTQIQGVIPIITHQLQHQQQSAIIGTTFKQTPKTVTTNVPNTILPFTPNSNNTVIPNIGNLTIIQSQQLLNDSKSKIIIINPITTELNATNNVVLAGNTITSATSSLNNIGHNNINNTTNINIGKKTLTKQQLINNNNQLSNAKVIDNISSSHLESSSSTISPIIIQSNDQLMQNSNIDNTIINNQLTNRKLSKNVATVTTNIIDGQTATGINQHLRKYKRGDKNQQQQQQNGNKIQEKNCNSLLSTSSSSSSTTTNHKNQHNFSSRPAVIILNDDSSNLSISNEFTFGDFKEEELRFYNSSNLINNNINDNCDNSGNSIVVGNTQSDTIIGNYSNSSNTTGGIYGNTTTLSQFSNDNLDDSGAQFSFGSIGNIESAINCNIVMNSTDIIHDNEHQQTQQQQQQHQLQNLSSPNSDYGYSSLSVNNRSIISDDNSIDISNKLSSTAHDIENNNSVQDIDDTIATANTKLGVTSNNNNISNNILSNHRDDDDYNINNKEISLLRNCNQQAIKQSTSCSPIKQSLLIENKENSSTSNSTIISNTLLSSSTASTSSALDSNKNIIISNIDNDKTNNSAATNTANTSTTGQIPNANRNINSNNNNCENQRRSIKEVNVRYVAPSQELNSMNFEKIVDFVGLAWEEIAHGNRGTQFYNGQ